VGKLDKGEISPDFSLEDQNGNIVNLSDYRGRKVLLYFYPKANTPGCTTQSCEVRDAKDDFNATGVDVIGISPDTVRRQKNFDEKHSLNFPLLSDEDHKVAELYGVWGEKKLYGKVYMGIIRSSFLIDEDGKIIESWYKISPKKTVPEAKSFLKNIVEA
jgi:peroxiredoxin Q/BCP